MQEQRPLVGRVVLITGATGGIGTALVRATAGAGAAVAVHHLGEAARGAELVGELRSAGVPAVLVEADVTQWDQVESMVADVEASLGPVDVLVNNAGVMDRTPFLETTLDQWRRTIEVDLTGVFLCCRHVAPQMVARGRGVIVNVASQLAFKGAHDYVPYSAAKGGVVSLTRALARELGPTIRVNAIAPGPTDTPMVARYSTEAWVEERTRDLVIRRLATADEVAATALFLATDAASLLHGQTLHVNGGGVMA